MNDNLAALLLNSKVTLTRLDVSNMICNNLPALHQKATILDVKACLSRLFPQQEAANEEELKAFTSSRCDNSLFDPRNSPYSPANQLIWQFICLSFPDYSNSQKMALWCPALKNAKSIIFNLNQRHSKASSSTHRSKRQRIEGCTEVALEYKDLDNLDPISLSDLAHFVFLEDNTPLILDMRLLSDWSFLAHKFFYNYIKETKPSWVSRIYTHNSSYRELKHLLAIYTCETNSLKEQISQLIKTLMINGTLRTGNEYAGEEAYSEISLFKNHYFEMQKTHPDIAHLSTQDGKSLQWIIDDCLYKGHCVETTALYLRRLLNANSGAHLLSLSMTQSAPDKEPSLALQSTIDRFRTIDTEIPLGLLKQAMANQPITDINMFMEILIGFPIEEYKHVLKAINIKFKRLNLIHLIESLPALGEEQLNELLDCFYRDREALKLPWQWLLSLAFNQSGNIVFLEKCIKAYKDSGDYDDKLNCSGCNWTFIDEAIFQNNKELISKALGVFKDIGFAQEALLSSTGQEYGIYMAARQGAEALLACLQAFPEYQWGIILIIILQNTPKEKIKPIKKNIKELLLLIDACHTTTLVKFFPDEFKAIPEFNRYNPDNQEKAYELPKPISGFSIDYNNILFLEDDIKRQKQEVIFEIMSDKERFIRNTNVFFLRLFKAFTYEQQFNLLIPEISEDKFPISMLFDNLDLFKALVKELLPSQVLALLHVKTSKGKMLLEQISKNHQEIIYELTNRLHPSHRHVIFSHYSTEFWINHFSQWEEEDSKKLIALIPLVDRIVMLRNAYPQSLTYPPEIFKAFVEGLDKHALLGIFDYLDPLELDANENISKNIDFLIFDATDEEIEQHSCISNLTGENIHRPPSPVY